MLECWSVSQRTLSATTCFAEDTIVDHVFRRGHYRRPRISQRTLSASTCFAEDTIGDHVFRRGHYRRPRVSQRTLSSTTCFAEDTIGVHVFRRGHYRRPRVSQRTLSATTCFAEDTIGDHVSRTKCGLCSIGYRIICPVQIIQSKDGTEYSTDVSDVIMKIYKEGRRYQRGKSRAHTTGMMLT